jgi:hypothetical protein
VIEMEKKEVSLGKKGVEGVIHMKAVQEGVEMTRK